MMIRNYFKLPNAILDYSFNSSTLKVISYLYSLMYHRKSAKVKIRQITIAQKCSLSVATVKRCISTLEAKGFIIHKSRSVKRNGYLGTYTYTLLPVGNRYFTVQRTALKLTGKPFVLIILMSKLRVTDKNSDTALNSFFHSLSDLSNMTGFKRSEVSSLIKILCESKLLQKSRRKTQNGDFTENYYFVGISAYKNSINHSVRFVKAFLRKIIKKVNYQRRTAKKLLKIAEKTKPIQVFSLFRGGGRNELSILYDPLITSFRRKNSKCFSEF